MTWLTAGGIAAGCAVATLVGKALWNLVEGAKEWVRMTLQLELSTLKAGLKDELNGRYPRKDYVERQFGGIDEHLKIQDAHLATLQQTVSFIAKNCPSCD